MDADSPLYGLNEEDLDEMDVEILVILDGIDETTATPIQASFSSWAWGVRGGWDPLEHALGWPGVVACRAVWWSHDAARRCA